MSDWLDWQEQGNCLDKDPEIFFQLETVDAAKAICETCPVRMKCLEYALSQDCNDGVFGGLNGYERRQLKKKIKQIKK